MAEQEKVVEMAAVKMPTQCMGFIKKNPKLARKVGKMLVMIHDMRNSANMVEQLLTRTDLFKEYIEDGTEEELTAFLQAAKTSQSDANAVIHVKNLPVEAFNKVIEGMGEHMVSTVIDDTPKEAKKFPG